MRKFITKKRIKVPRYKLYYLAFGFSLVIIFFFNIILTLIWDDGNEEFLNVWVGNSYGNVIEYHLTGVNDLYLFKNSFGMDRLWEETVMGDKDSLENIVVTDLEEVVYIYNTFQTDKYKSDFFHSYSIGSYVTQASFILREYLKEKGIGSIVESDSVASILKSNNIPYTNSYAASRILLEKRIEENPSLKYYFDLQLSDYDYAHTTAVIDGVSYAKILFVVGTDNKNYEKNRLFAVHLENILAGISKDLSRGISLRGGTGYQGVYNQDFSNYALLIQVGGINNTIEEVNRSLEVLSQVISTYIKEVNHESK